MRRWPPRTMAASFPITCGDLHNRLPAGPVHLSRHDRAARLQIWQLDLGRPVQWANPIQRMSLASWSAIPRSPRNAPDAHQPVAGSLSFERLAAVRNSDEDRSARPATSGASRRALNGHPPRCRRSPTRQPGRTHPRVASIWRASAERRRNGVHQVFGFTTVCQSGRVRAAAAALDRDGRPASVAAMAGNPSGRWLVGRLRHVHVVVGDCVTPLAAMDAMLVGVVLELVPEPVWKTSMGSWCRGRPSAISAAGGDNISPAPATRRSEFTARRRLSAELARGSGCAQPRPGCRRILHRAGLRARLALCRHADFAHGVVLDASNWRYRRQRP